MAGNHETMEQTQAEAKPKEPENQESHESREMLLCLWYYVSPIFCCLAMALPTLANPWFPGWTDRHFPRVTLTHYSCVHLLLCWTPSPSVLQGMVPWGVCNSSFLVKLPQMAMLVMSGLSFALFLTNYSGIITMLIVFYVTHHLISYKVIKFIVEHFLPLEYKYYNFCLLSLT